eukprot:767108-Hanusia_phi.AAC.5
MHHCEQVVLVALARPGTCTAFSCGVPDLSRPLPFPSSLCPPPCFSLMTPSLACSARSCLCCPGVTPGAAQGRLGLRD